MEYDKMIALKRDTEIWKQSDWNNWVYEHLDWLTTPRPDGDGYELIEIPDVDPENEQPKNI